MPWTWLLKYACGFVLATNLIWLFHFAADTNPKHTMTLGDWFPSFQQSTAFTENQLTESWNLLKTFSSSLQMYSVSSYLGPVYAAQYFTLNAALLLRFGLSFIRQWRAVVSGWNLLKLAEQSAGVEWLQAAVVYYKAASLTSLLILYQNGDVLQHCCAH